jgi:hypothetical protein
MTRKKISIRLWITSAICLFLFSGCLKDNCRHTYSLYKPIYKTLRSVRANMKGNAPTALQETGKLYIFGKYIFLNELNKGIHIIDNTTPADPKNVAFIDIPGNVDLAVKGNTLYADSYGDLVTFDITDPRSVTAKNFLDNVFPERRNYYLGNNSVVNPDSILIISGWVSRDTTVDCETYKYLYENFYASASADKSGSYASPGGQGGSMARFTLADNYLYTVTTNALNTFDLTTPQQPSFVKKTPLDNWSIETIFPLKDKLFIGSSAGMFIYDISTPATPAKLGSFSHVRSCDPVIAEEQYAYVTLRSGTACQGFANQLEVLNVSNLSSPTLLKTYPLTNPHGLAKDGNLLFICDGKDGVKIFNAADVNNIKLLKQIDGLDAYDVIVTDNRALVVAKDGLYQFNYTDVNNVKLLSKLSLNNQ